MAAIHQKLQPWNATFVTGQTVQFPQEEARARPIEQHQW